MGDYTYGTGGVAQRSSARVHPSVTSCSHEVITFDRVLFTFDRVLFCDITHSFHLAE